MIELKNILFYYEPEKPILSDLSVTIPLGKWTLMIGHNGSGKSTVAKLVAGLLKPVSGTISINNETYQQHNFRSLRKQVGYLFQNPNQQLFGTTVRANLAFGLQNQNWSAKMIDQAIEKIAQQCQLNTLLDRSMQSLSGGEKQRVAIASALISQPSILILDESFAMLDPISKQQLRALIREWKNLNNGPVIEVSHEQESFTNADYIIIFPQNQRVISLPIEQFWKEENQQWIKLSPIAEIAHSLQLPITNDSDELIQAICSWKHP